MLAVSPAWRTAWPGAVVGILAMEEVANPDRHPGLEERLVACEAGLRARFGAGDRAALRALPVLEAYAAYYGRYRKTYHVQLQLESVALRGKPLPRGPALVAAMVMAELQHQLLTAGHDLQALRPPVTLGVASGDEHYRLLRGDEQPLKAGDMMMADAEGVISSVLYGPDARTRLTSTTRGALFVVYAPPGIGELAVREHLETLRDAVQVVAPRARAATLETVVAA